MVAEEIVVCLSGGAPWGFRLQGGAEQNRPLQVAKVRRRSKACRAGLKEQDELVSIGEHQCSELSHAEAMRLLDQHNSSLQLRVKRPSPGSCPRSPPGFCLPPQTSCRRTMSGYESASDAVVTQRQWDVPYTIGVPKRELILQPDWETPTHTPHTLTPHTLTPHTLSPTPDLGEGDGEGDSGFQEASGSGGGLVLACPPLVSPERAKEALLLVSGQQLVPMVGPQESAVNDELSTTYKDKARQAKLQRGESQVEKQVKEARTKCRSIASLLTDAPNPNSKGKYTLTCFGKAPEDKGSETEGDTEEEGGSSILSGSELDEEGFSASYDPTWDSGYFDLLEKRSSACPSTTPTTPTSNPNLSLDFSINQTPPFQIRLVFKDSKLENGISLNHTPMSPPAMPLTNGGAVEVSRANVVLTPPSHTPKSKYARRHNVLNRTARPFTPGSSTPSRPSVTSVMFRPPQPKPVFANAPPVTAVSMMTLLRRAARFKTSSVKHFLYIPARNTNGTSSEYSSIQSTPSSLSSDDDFPSNCESWSLFTTIFCEFGSTIQPSKSSTVPIASKSWLCCSSNLSTHTPVYLPPSSMNPVQPYVSPAPQQLASPGTPNYPKLCRCQFSISFYTCQSLFQYSNYQCSTISQVPNNDSLASREQRIAVPAARTGILNEARKRSQKKPMFSAIQSKDVNPNPDLLSMVQNMDDRYGKDQIVEANNGVPVPETGMNQDQKKIG
ncbi:hypothetical protein WMY93_013617 [Mugilogobius chulae]|uniref:Synaptopodin 2-like protein n=1 Tax=Mugilogobius chulae TaxID=88201 RepID=A0AAW0P6U0_9GOBI